MMKNAKKHFLPFMLSFNMKLIYIYMNKSGAIQVPAQKVFKLITYFHLRPSISCYTLHSRES